MQRDFEGGVYRDELADKCGDISRAAGFRGAGRFPGNTVCESRFHNKSNKPTSADVLKLLNIKY